MELNYKGKDYTIDSLGYDEMLALYQTVKTEGGTKIEWFRRVLTAMGVPPFPDPDLKSHSAGIQRLIIKDAVQIVSQNESIDMNRFKADFANYIKSVLTKVPKARGRQGDAAASPRKAASGISPELQALDRLAEAIASCRTKLNSETCDKMLAEIEIAKDDYHLSKYISENTKTHTPLKAIIDFFHKFEFNENLFSAMCQTANLSAGQVDALLFVFNQKSLSYAEKQAAAAALGYTAA